MRRSRVVLSALALAGLGFVSTVAGGAGIEKLFAKPPGEKSVAYEYLGYSGVVVCTAKGTVVIDPGRLLTPEEMQTLAARKVSVVLFTHAHGDHFDRAAAARLVAEAGATVVAAPAVAKALEGLPPGRVITAEPGRVVEVGGLSITPIQGRHIGPIMLFQVKAGGVTLFHGGDSAHVPLGDFPADVAFLPAGRPSPTASPGDALSMALDVKPRAVVVMHASPGQSRELERDIRTRLPGTVVRIPAEHRAYAVVLR